MSCSDVEVGDGYSVEVASPLVVDVFKEGRVDGFIEESYSLHYLFSYSEGVPVGEVFDEGEVCWVCLCKFCELAGFKPHVIRGEGPTVMQWK